MTLPPNPPRPENAAPPRVKSSAACTPMGASLPINPLNAYTRPPLTNTWYPRRASSAARSRLARARQRLRLLHLEQRGGSVEELPVGADAPHGELAGEGARGEGSGEGAEEGEEVPLGVNVVEAEVEDEGVIDEAERGGLHGVVLDVPRRALVLLDDGAEGGEAGDDEELADGEGRRGSGARICPSWGAPSRAATCGTARRRRLSAGGPARPWIGRAKRVLPRRPVRAPRRRGRDRRRGEDGAQDRARRDARRG